ncbi:MAG TPA: sigma-70 family RNA polymerase sigma factor [Candidatus Acidoferrales bacterium]|jgi:RNA polymerase sigma-70 factor (ECF subfamily)|nr:sigma-70 family RNA polymerase sigma factor [Candidatus Acidoferrales bacterium]
MPIEWIAPVAGACAATGQTAVSLVSRLQARDGLALGELYDQFGTCVYRVVLGLVRDAATAENLTQETFLYIWNRIGGFDAARGSLAAWVGLVARSRAIDYLRSVECRMARSAAPLGDAEHYAQRYPQPAAAHGGLTQVERVRLLQGPWMRLQRCERQALRLAYYWGLSQPEIAERLNRPLGTIKTWMRRGLQSLRADLEGASEI